MQFRIAAFAARREDARASGVHWAFQPVKSKLLVALLAALLGSPVYAQLRDGSAFNRENFHEDDEPLWDTPGPPERTPDRSTKPPQQVDLSAPGQMDFSVDAALADTPADRRDRTPAPRRPPVSLDRMLDRHADRAVDSAVGASK